MPRRNSLKAFGTAAVGAALLVLVFAVGARAATVDHFRINSVAVTEGNAGTVNMTFTISYTGPLNNISVDWATANGTAVAGADYVAASGTATFLAAGPASKTITIQAMGDVLDENNETFTVNLTNPQPPATADITTATGTGTINDNDPTPSLVINDVTVPEGNSGTSNANFTVTLSAVSGRNVTVNYATANSTAMQPADYTSTSGTLTFTPGQVTKTVSVPVIGDVLDEIDEAFFVNLSAAGNAIIADNQGVGTITDDDPAPSLSINDVSLAEGNAGTANMTFTVTLSAASGKTVTADWAAADGTATAPADYVVSAGTVSFAPGIVTRTFVVPIAGDTLDEFDETLFANLTNAVNATISDNQGIGTIVDNDPLPTLAFANVTVTEGDSGTLNASFTVTQSAASAKTVTVDYATANGTATQPADYTSTSGTLMFTPGQTTKTINVPIVGDLLNEANETYTLALSNPVNATVPTATRTGTITDNDPLPSIVIDDVSVTEGNSGTSNANFTVTLSAPSGRNVTVNYATANSTAVQPADYTTTSGTLTFTPGQVTKTVSVPVVGDVLDEIDEAFFVNLTVPTNSTIADNQGIGTITDDDPAPSITINDVSIVEGNAGTANMTFTATLSAASGKTVTVDYATADVTATSPADYTVAAGTLTFNPGVITRTFVVPIVGDTLNEFNETFVANLTNATNATIADTQGIGTILDDDLPPTVDVNNVTVTEGDVGTTTATFTVSLSAPSGKAISVDHATADGTATAPSDYTAIPTTTLNFAPGQTSKTVDVTVNGDANDEFDETYTLGLSSLVNVSAGTVVGTGTITDDDPLPTVSVGDVSVAEGDVGTTTATFTVALSAASGKPISVDYTTADGTATAPSDYTAVSTTTLNFAPGETSKTVDVTVKSDTTFENDETFGFSLSNLLNVAPGTVGATGTIRNDDVQPQISVDDPSVTEGDAGTATATFTVSLTNPSAFPITADYVTNDGSASSPADYAGISTMTLTFVPGVTTQTVDVTVNGDLLNEFDETFTLDLSSPASATIADTQGIGTILDDDLPPTVDVNNVSVAEGDAGTTIATFTVSLSAPSGKTISVDYATADGTAIAPGDYIATSGSVSFAPGETSKTVDVAVNGDLLNEFNEMFTLDLSSIVNVDPGSVSGTGTIDDNDALPTVAVGDVSVLEGDVGTKVATFTVTLSAPSGKPISVDYATADGTAAAGTDYVGTSGTLNFAPGETSKTVDVTVKGDTTFENDETFGSSLSNLLNVAPGTVGATGTIRNDDPLPQISIDDPSVTEGNAGTTATFTVSLTNPSASLITVDYATANGTATSPLDYTAASGTVTFPPGSTTQTVDVPVVGDLLNESNETFVVNLTNPGNATIADNQGVGTILDDDLQPTVDVNNASVAEGDIGSTPATFTVSLSATSGKTISVDYATADGSALAGSGDYVASSGTLTFNPGVTTQPVAVTVNGDSTFELVETFTLTLSNPSATTIGAGVGFGTILNDDITPGLAVTDVSVPEGNTGDTLATFTVALGAPSAFPVTVDVATLDGTATEPSDYDTVVIPSLTFAPGETIKTVDVTIHGDTAAEPNETFTVQLSNAVGATIGDDTGIGTITDDDTVAPPPPPPPADPVASIGDASTIEGAKGSSTILAFPVNLTRVATGEVTIDYRTMDGSATGGSDFLGAAGSLRVPAGSLTGTVKITVLGDDRVEPDETFTLHVAGVAGATPGADGTGTIVNDDRSSTRLTLHVRVHGHRARTSSHRIDVRGRLIGGAKGLPVTLVLMRERDDRWIALDRATIRTRRKPHVMASGATAFGYRSTFHVTRGGRYRIRVNFRGDDLHAPTRAHVRFRI